MIAMPFTALVTVAALVLTFVLSLRVGNMRRKHGVKAPASTGHPEFEAANRIHQNTIEQLVLFLPVLWLALYVLGDAITGVIGAVWIVGRIVYANAYARDPATRGPGMGITMLPTVVLLLAALWGILQGVIA